MKTKAKNYITRKQAKLIIEKNIEKILKKVECASSGFHSQADGSAPPDPGCEPVGQVANNFGGCGCCQEVCWVAREIYGIQDVRWKIFRLWLFQKSPNWLFNLYLNNGEDFSKFIKNKPFIKFVIKILMNYAIKSMRMKFIS